MSLHFCDSTHLDFGLTVYKSLFVKHTPDHCPILIYYLIIVTLQSLSRLKFTV